MKFAAIYFNWLLLLVPALLVLFSFANRRRKMMLSFFAQEHLTKEIAGTLDLKRRRNKSYLLIGGMLFLVLALLRPQWGFVWEENKASGVDIFLAVDVSQSMLTKDVLPSRLERTKLAIEDLVGYLQADRVGLIAFAGSAFVQCPLTIDYDGFLLAVSDLNAKSISSQGTNIESAINKAQESFAAGSQGNKKVLIIITDGENHEADPLPAVQKAAAENIKIFTVGVGTPDGELIQVTDDTGQTVFLKDKQGHVVKSRLNEELLKNIALKAEGAYVKSTPTQFGLEFLYKNKIAVMKSGGASGGREKRFKERFQLPLLLALVLLFAEPVISERKRK